MNPIHKTGVVLYALIAIVTFGHAINLPHGSDSNGQLYHAYRAMFGPLAWPLYWSAQMWEPKP